MNKTTLIGLIIIASFAFVGIKFGEWVAACLLTVFVVCQGIVTLLTILGNKRAVVVTAQSTTNYKITNAREIKVLLFFLATFAISGWYLFFVIFLLMYVLKWQARATYLKRISIPN